MVRLALLHGAHYQQGSLGFKASSYGMQALIALATAFGTGLHFAKVYTGTNPGAFVWLALAMLAMVWLYESAQGICQIAVEAAEFADNAIMSVESQEEIPGFFDEFYPWMFYKK